MVTEDGGACNECGGETVVRPVPPGCRGLLATDPGMVRVCQRCLTVTPAPGEPATRPWHPESLSDALPPSPAAAVAVAMLVTFLSSLALHREEIEAVVEFLEAQEGVDPLLAVQRIAQSGTFDPVADLDRREHQLAQILGEER